MTYCVAVKLDAGLVFLSDSRTNAGLDAISTFRKMMIYEKPGDRFMVMLSAGNLSISQQVREILQIEELANADGPPITIWNATSMFDAARVLGAAMRRVPDRDRRLVAVVELLDLQNLAHLLRDRQVARREHDHEAVARPLVDHHLAKGADLIQAGVGPRVGQEHQAGIELDAHAIGHAELPFRDLSR